MQRTMIACGVKDCLAEVDIENHVEYGKWATAFVQFGKNGLRVSVCPSHVERFAAFVPLLADAFADAVAISQARARDVTDAAEHAAATR